MVYFHCSFIYLFTGQLCCDRDYAKTSTANIKFAGQGEEHFIAHVAHGLWHRPWRRMRCPSVLLIVFVIFNRGALF